MPFLLKQQKDDSLLGIWKITEDLTSLKSALLLLDKNCSFPEVKNGERFIEWIVVRLLLYKLTGKMPVVTHAANGRPILLNSSMNLSVSHTRGLLAVVLSPQVLGVDVERLDRPIRRVAPRFLSKIELDNCLGQEQPDMVMLLHWCTKEAVFKWTPEEQVDFQKQIRIVDFSMQGSAGNVTVIYSSHKKQETILHFQIMILEDYLLVYGPYC